MSGIIAQNVGRHTGLIKAAEGGGGAWNVIQSITASGDASVSFTSGIDSTYKQYYIAWNNVNTVTGGESDAGVIQMNFSVDSGSNYNVSKTSSYYAAYHKEDDNEAYAAYSTYWDGTKTTAQTVMNSMGAAADECGAGYIYLFNPSDTTFIKHFFGTHSVYHQDDFSQNGYFAGYANTTSAIDAVQFTALGASYSGSDNFDGVFTLYGIT